MRPASEISSLPTKSRYFRCFDDETKPDNLLQFAPVIAQRHAATPASRPRQGSRWSAPAPRSRGSDGNLLTARAAARTAAHRAASPRRSQRKGADRRSAPVPSPKPAGAREGAAVRAGSSGGPPARAPSRGPSRRQRRSLSACSGWRAPDRRQPPGWRLGCWLRRRTWRGGGVHRCRRA